MTDFIRVYGALPIATNDAGQILPDRDATTRHQNADNACLAAEAMSQKPGYVAGVAFTRTIDLLNGECGRSIVIAPFGDLSARQRWTEY